MSLTGDLNLKVVVITQDQFLDRLGKKQQKKSIVHCKNDLQIIFLQEKKTKLQFSYLKKSNRKLKLS